MESKYDALTEVEQRRIDRLVNRDLRLAGGRPRSASSNHDAYADALQEQHDASELLALFRERWASESPERIEEELKQHLRGNARDASWRDR